MQRTWNALSMLVAVSVSAGAMAQPKAPAKAGAQEEVVVNGYLAIQGLLAADKTDGVSSEAAKLEKAVAALGKQDKSLEPMKAQVKALAGAKDLAAMREAFKPVSASFIQYAQRSYKGARKLGVYHCGMANGSWVQEGTDVRNPYYGAEMLSCGERVADGASAGTPAPAAAPHDHSKH